MKMIEIATLDNGAHRNQTFNGSLPDGWAIVPTDLETANFPFGEVTIKEIDGLMTVTEWTPGTIPEPDEPEQEPETVREPNFAEDTAAMLIDHEYRLTLLELGLTE